MLLANNQGFSPVNLSYVAALRFVQPRPAAAFKYLHVGCNNIAEFVALAASNPNGHFIGLILSTGDILSLQKFCQARGVGNVEFRQATCLDAYVSAFTAEAANHATFDYVIADATSHEFAESERASLFALVEYALKPNGLFAYRYATVANADESLRFLVNEYAPEFTVEQAREFLQELKILGESYFAAHPITLAALERAIERNLPDEFFATCEEGAKPVSMTFETLAGLLPRGFAFVGDAESRQNYLELSAPAAAHELLLKCRSHLLYEPIKDFVTQRPKRTDIWCRLPATQSDDTAELFGYFAFGLTMPLAEIPPMVAVNGKAVDLSSSLFQRLIRLMELLPCTIGDFLHHPEGKGERPSDVLVALQTLVACGYARPMRSTDMQIPRAQADLKPMLAEGFNRYLTHAVIDSPRVTLASPVVGDAVNLPAREALVLQAVARNGISQSADALLPELLRIAHNPELASKIMDVAEPTPAIAQLMVEDVLQRSMVRWYAYGLMAAA